MISLTKIPLLAPPFSPGFVPPPPFEEEPFYLPAREEKDCSHDIPSRVEPRETYF